MEYELIPDEAYDNLPDEPEAKFVSLARTAQASVARLIEYENSSGDFTTEVRTQFMETIRATADALGIPGLPPEQRMSDMNPYEEYRYFCTKLSGVIAKVKLQSQATSRPYSVQLGHITKARIRQEAEQLRVYIEESDLPQKKKKLVSSKVDALIAELDKTRLGFGQVAAITASIATTIAGGMTAIAKAPEAYQSLNTIWAAIGGDKEREEAEQERLAPPPQSLPSPEMFAESSKSSDLFSRSLDDDVPF